MNIRQVNIPTFADLSTQIDTALEESQISAAQLVDKLCQNIVSTIKTRPKSYLNYGPYWWAIKKIMNEYGHGAFLGPTENPLVEDHFTVLHDDEHMRNLASIAIAIEYYNERVNNHPGELLANHDDYTHKFMRRDEDGQLDIIEYDLIDEDIEAHIYNMQHS